MSASHGQSLGHGAAQVALFGGFDDFFLHCDWLTGRVRRVPTLGRTALYPWDVDHFLVAENVLGRESQFSLSMRSYFEPGQVHEALPVATLGTGLSDDSRIVPGHLPNAFAIAGGHYTQLDLANLPGEVFVAGVTNSALAVRGATAIDYLVDSSGTRVEVGVAGAAAVGHRDTWWVAGEDLAIVTAAAVHQVPLPAGKGVPRAIEHDAARRLLLVALWRRWRAIGGPRTDVLLLDESGAVQATGRFDVLVERMALVAGGLAGIDVSGGVHAGRVE